MHQYNRLELNSKSMLTMYNSAIARYNRQDPIGAADTLRNMAKTINPSTNFHKVEATPGTIENAIAAYSEGKFRHTLQILKYLSLEMHYGRLAA